MDQLNIFDQTVECNFWIPDRLHYRPNSRKSSGQIWWPIQQQPNLVQVHHGIAHLVPDQLRQAIDQSKALDVYDEIELLYTQFDGVYMEILEDVYGAVLDGKSQNVLTSG